MSVHSYRLTHGDEARICDAIRCYLSSARVDVVQSGHVWDVHAFLASSFNAVTAQRLACHAIGCTANDLRDVELDYIDQTITDFRDEVQS